MTIMNIELHELELNKLNKEITFKQEKLLELQDEVISSKKIELAYTKAIYEAKLKGLKEFEFEELS